MFGPGHQAGAALRTVGASERRPCTACRLVHALRSRSLMSVLTPRVGVKLSASAVKLSMLQVCMWGDAQQGRQVASRIDPRQSTH